MEGQKWSESNQSAPLGQASIGPAERRFITRLPAAAIAEVIRLVEAGANSSAQDDDGWSPLRFAAQAGSAAITRILIAAGATVDLRDSNGNTPVGKAVFSSRGDGTVIKLLRDAGADPYAENASGVTPLALARTIANFDVAQFFSDLPSARD